MRNPESIDRLISETLAGFGMERLDVVLALYDEWDTLVPEPWRSWAEPGFLREGELLVEATSPQAVSLLRYAVGDLLRTLDRRFGDGIFSSVRVQSPPSSARPSPR